MAECENTKANQHDLRTRQKVLADICDAKAVRPDQPHPRFTGDIDHARLKRRAFGIDLGETGAEDHRPAHATGGAFLDRLGGQRSRQRDHRQIRNQRCLGKRRIGGQALHLGGFRVDWQDRAREPAPPEKVHWPPADAPGVA